MLWFIFTITEVTEGEDGHNGNTVVPPNTAVLGTAEKPAVFRNSSIWREYNLKKPYLGLEMGIGREAVLGGVVLGGTTVMLIMLIILITLLMFKYAQL